jgi:hypothetical protein
MTQMQRQRSCSWYECATRIGSSKRNVHVASVWLLDIISYSINSYYIIS